jgi:Tfp pilus assembly protein PilO
MRFLLPTLFIIAAIALFVGFTNPIYGEVQRLNIEAQSYEEALANSRLLQIRRDELTQTYNSFPQSSLQALNTMVPDSVDNIGLIQEVQRIALSLGLIVKNVNFDPSQIQREDEEGNVQSTVSVRSTGSSRSQNQTNGNGLYETFFLEFTVEGSYGDFVEFLRALERNLRIVDISQIRFTASSLNNQGSFSDVYDYTFTTKTYRLISE